jgi:hypothetical protein
MPAIAGNSGDLEETTMRDQADRTRPHTAPEVLRRIDDM